MRSALIAAAGIATICLVGTVAVVGTVGAGAGGGTSTATLRTADGRKVGTVEFERDHHLTYVEVKLRFDPTSVAADAFHGFHIHANNDAANGRGCVADAAADPATWFTAVDGHWKIDGQDHGAHHGDMPILYVTPEGYAQARFTIDQTTGPELRGKAVVIHAGPDNYANVPVGAATNQYTANSADAVTATKATGNAGVRIACGIIG